MTRPTTTGKAQDLITFTRSTTGTYLDSVTYGDELITNGTFDTDFTGWTDVSTGTGSVAVVLGQAQLTRVNLNNRGIISQDITVVAGATYKVQITEVSGVAYVGAGTTATSTTLLGQPLATGENTFYITPNATSVYINVRGVADGVQLIDNVSVKEVIGGQGTQGTPLLRTSAIDEARIEYDASGNCLGLLVEEARTNELLRSERIGAWSGSVGSKTNVTLTENVITAPDGTQTADKVQRTVLDTSADYRQTKSVVAGNDYTFSIFAKADVQAKLELDFSNSKFTSNDYVRFDVDTGTAYGSGVGATYSITNYGNGWYRFSLTATCTASGDTGVIARITNNEPHYAWGAQFEQGSFPTSYLPTSVSAVTRSKDVASLALSKFGYNQDQFSVVVKSDFFGDDGTSYLCYIGEDSTNRVILYYSNQNINFQVKSGGVNQATETLSGHRNKAAYRYKLNDMNLAADGDITTEDTPPNLLMGGTQNNIYIGGSYSAGSILNGHIKSIQYYPLGLPNAQLQALTL